MTIPPQEPDPLSIDREAMRAIGHRVVDMLVDRIDRLGDERPFLPTHREEMETRLREPRPTPTTIDVILRQLETDVLPFGARWDHPRFFAYIPGSGT